MTDLETAKAELAKGKYTFAAVKDGSILTSEKRGLRPLLELLGEGKAHDTLVPSPLAGYSVADKVVGKAPALLYTLLGPVTVYAYTGTGEAERILKEAGINVIFDDVTDKILNDSKDDICPMEKLVSDTDDAAEALERILSRIR